jgi:RecB family exonuclease
MMVAAMPVANGRVVFRVTPAQAHTWALCGGFFQVQYQSGRPYVATYNRLLGTSVHELVVAFDRSTSGMQQHLDELITHNWRPGRFAAVDDQRALAEARTLLTAYAAMRQTETAQVLGSEVFCQTAPRAIGTDYTIVLSGRIDRIARRNDGTIELLDVKTGAYLPTHDELSNDPATTIYHILAAERYSGQRISVAQLSLRTGGRVEVTLDATGVAAGKALLREMVRQLATEDFSLVPSAACAFCPARTTCPALLNADTAIERPL